MMIIGTNFEILVEGESIGNIDLPLNQVVVEELRSKEEFDNYLKDEIMGYLKANLTVEINMAEVMG